MKNNIQVPLNIQTTKFNQINQNPLKKTRKFNYLREKEKMYKN